MPKNTCETCMHMPNCMDATAYRKACGSYKRDPFNPAKGEAKWTFKRKAGK